MFKNYLNLTKCLLAEFQFFDGLFTFLTKLNAREKLAGNSKNILSIYFTKTLGMDIAVNRDAV